MDITTITGLITEHSGILLFTIVILMLAAVPTGARKMLRWTSKPEHESNTHDLATAENTHISYRHQFWVCNNCSQEFRVPDSVRPPLRCPKCGKLRNPTDRAANAEQESHICQCPACRKFTEMTDGTEMRFCPYCSHEL